MGVCLRYLEHAQGCGVLSGQNGLGGQACRGDLRTGDIRLRASPCLALEYIRLQQLSVWLPRPQLPRSGDRALLQSASHAARVHLGECTQRGQEGDVVDEDVEETKEAEETSEPTIETDVPK